MTNYPFVQSLFENGVVTGCGGTRFCPNDLFVRYVLPLWYQKAKYDGNYDPGAADGMHFNDVTTSTPNAAWIEDSDDELLSDGCDNSDNFCPYMMVSEAEAAMFALKANKGNTHVPPMAKGNVFDDVGALDHLADWIEEAYAENLVDGCDPDNFCPKSAVSFSGFAKMLARAKNLPIKNGILGGTSARSNSPNESNNIGIENFILAEPMNPR